MPAGPGHQPENTGETPEGTQQEASSGAGWLRGQGCGQVLGGFMGAHAGLPGGRASGSSPMGCQMTAVPPSDWLQAASAGAPAGSPHALHQNLPCQWPPG